MICDPALHADIINTQPSHRAFDRLQLCYYNMVLEFRRCGCVTWREQS